MSELRRPSATSSKVTLEDSVPDDEVEDDNCLICLGGIVDQTVLPACLHSLFCFDCIIKWTNIHRRCPLCSAAIEGYLIHSIRSDHDYIRHYLTTINGEEEREERATSESALLRRQLQRRISRDPVTREVRYDGEQREHCRARPISHSTERNTGNEWGVSQAEERQRDAIANWDRRLAFRSKVYREEMYCLHVGSNSTSKLRPTCQPSSIMNDKSVESALLSFIRRELLAYPITIDVDFMARYIINVIKSFDIKSQKAIELISDFLGSRGAQHFCHELYSFCRYIGAPRSYHRDKVKAFDEWAQYPPSEQKQTTKFLTGAVSVAPCRQNGRREEILARLKAEKDLLQHKGASDPARLASAESPSALAHTSQEESLRHELLTRRKPTAQAARPDVDVVQ